MTADDMHEKVNETMHINEKPRKYTPQVGDILEWKDIQLRVKRVTAGGEVLLEHPTDETGDPPLSPRFGDQHAATDEPPLGIQTWATMEFNPTPADMIRLLENGWTLTYRGDGES